MPELLPTAEGPLDVARRLNYEAATLNDAVYDYSSLSSADVVETKRKLSLLDNQHPLMQQEVVVSGMSLTMSMGDEGRLIGLSLVPDNKCYDVRGIYHGYTVEEVYYPEDDIKAGAIVHMVLLETVKFVDSMRNGHMDSYYAYLLVDESEVRPVLPHNAHSFLDLHGDPALAKFQEVVGRGAGPTETIQQLGEVAVRVLAEEEEHDIRNHQLVSYLNSLGLLQNVAITTNELLLARRDDYLRAPAGKEVSFQSGEEPIKLQPHLFDMLPGYMRAPDGEMIWGGAPELFSTAKLKDGRSIMVPFAAITGLEQSQ